VLWLPLAGSEPLQPPDALHEVAFEELQVSVEALPSATEIGFAARVTVAVPRTVTVTVATLLVPPAPLQVSTYDVVVMSEIFSVPLVALDPPQPPDAIHEVALVELQINVEAPPLLTVVCAALKEAVGSGSLVDGLTVTPHAAGSTDAPKVKTRTKDPVRFALSGVLEPDLNFNRIDIQPTNHELIFIKNPHHQQRNVSMI
jgi:hypothetical protein